ncbi:mutator mutT protein [Beggiatoa sp. PS]|nr:mutator mutT protein [Beggiatoa sp. PS]
MNEFLHVVAGVIYNAQKEILLAYRPKHTHQGGLWEFPGGKRQPQETVEQALVRELQEEIGITVQQTRPLIRIAHTYPERKVLLDVWEIEQWQDKAYGREGQLIQWCPIDSLRNHSFPAANYPIITAVQLPSHYLITPEPVSWHDKKFFYRLEQCLDGEISLMQLRAKNLSERDYCYCAEKTLTLCDRYDTKLLANATAEMALSVGTHGVHLTSERLLTCTERPLDKTLWVAASCHSIAEIEQANQIGIDFIVLSPVRPTESHPEVQPLGWFEFFQRTEQANCPVFALGGMKWEDTAIALAHGAQGIAAISAFWQ